MLYILTGPIQSGKTRWVQEVVRLLEQNTIYCEGVVAPGIWDKKDNTYIKEGIFNELLPSHERVIFGLKADESKGIIANLNCGENPSANSGWYIDPDAVNRVNRHFNELEQSGQRTYSKDRRILIIDELGVLELIRNEGLTGASSLLARGPRNYYSHALVVVRDKKELPQIAKDNYAEVWGGAQFIFPDKIEPSTFINSLC